MLQTKLLIFFAKPITDEDGFFQILILKSDHKIKSLNNENKRILIEEDLFTEVGYPFQIKTKISTLGSFIGISNQGPMMVMEI